MACAFWALSALADSPVVYVADIGGVIYQYNVTSGNAAPLLASSELNGAVGLAQEASGDLLVSTVGTNAIRRINHVTNALTVLSQGGLLQNPDLMGIVGPEVFVNDIVAHAIFGVNTTTGMQRTVVNGGLSNGGPWMCSGSDGFLYVSRNSNSTVVRVNPASGTENVVSTGGLLSNILGIAYGPDHFLYVCCGTVQRIVRVDPSSGAQAQVVQGGFPGNPYGISVAADGFLWVSVEQSNILMRVNPSTGAMDAHTIPGMSQPYGVFAGTSVTPPPPPPSDLPSCSASEDRPDSVIVQWAAASGQVDYYQIDRDGVTIATVPSAVLRYADKPAQGPHSYCVHAANLGGSSNPCCDAGQLKPPVSQPHLDFVRDVPHDQGGKVMLGWARSDLDIAGGTVIGYRVWRRLPTSAQEALRIAGGRPIRTMTLGPQTVYWEALVDLPAGQLPGYGYIAATSQDSLPGSNPFTAFFVTALTEYQDIFYDSNVDSGYSVDNLAPDTPQGIQGAYLTTGGVKIQWLPSRAPDVGEYNIYRGATQSFVPSDFNRLGSTTDTTFVDPNAASYFYKLSAVDVHGNESGFALLKPSDIPVAALVQQFEADPVTEGVQITLDLAIAPGAYGVRLWRSETESRLGAVALTPDAVPMSSTHYVYLDATAPKTKLWYWVDLVGQSGSAISFGPVTVIPAGAFPSTILLAPQPNPSTSGVDFGYTIGSDVAGTGHVLVRLVLFDTRGKLVRVLQSGSQPVGRYQVHWDGNDEHGARLGTGVYQYRLQVGSQAHSGKVIRI
jgi:sugar lactone lactonase YvrE